jgi:hypothetical protein
MRGKVRSLTLQEPDCARSRIRRRVFRGEVASAAGAAAITKPGAQTALPRLADLKDLFGLDWPERARGVTPRAHHADHVKSSFVPAERPE